MLDSETKKRIDDARNMLVGKVPDPKAQVEQITIALIYKFMDDIDAESEELGGERTFFTGDFAQYGWAKLMHPGLGGHETLKLYAEGIAKIPENPGIPSLFRDIFKNAFLPYRDPETLKSFLKIINEFTYDHSERLGDAFEYLLSVLGAQGDAGQFRTPRHIIDFMIQVVDPKKDETILDPACGTAGFLISSYKHILKSNTDKEGNSKLTPDEKGRLAQNFKGYDISPDMVRLSLVNLYLHGFSAPSIDEYDTLTSEDKWDELADVVLANPPFMSPKGGIKPHKRFSVQSKRSEVLFVDYMAEHLTQKGRAAIIVPEGIIFQSQNAYKQLRKMMVENYLVAVVSLPVGVFNPYSGVKTSILIFDKALAKKSETIGFFKVESDGFDLGAQRREIDKDNLPEALKEITEYLALLRSGESLDEFNPTLGLITPKDKIAENGEYNLSGERYRIITTTNSKFPKVSLEDVCEFVGGTQPPKTTFIYEPKDGYIRLLQIRDYKSDEKKVYIPKSERHKTCTTTDIMIGRYGPPVFQILKGKEGAYNVALMKCQPDPKRILNGWLYHFLKSTSVQEKIIGLSGRARQSGVRPDDLRELQIPLPPLEIQKEIVAEIEGYQKVIDGARAVVDNYRPHIAINLEWPIIELGAVCDVRDGTHDSPKYVTEGYPLITSKNLKNGYIDFTNVNLISRKDLDAINKRSKVETGDILMPMIGTIGSPIIADVSREYGIKNVALIKFYNESKLNNYFLKNILASSEMQRYFERQSSGSTQKFLSLGFIRKLLIPLPPLEMQQQTVAEIKAEQALVNANQELIDRFDKKVQAAIARVWCEGDVATDLR
jgi:type I restriction enzyme M protein